MKTSKYPINSKSSLVYPWHDMRWFLPGFLGWLLFYAIPFGISILFSLFANSAKIQLVWLNNYRAILLDSTYILSLKNYALFIIPVIIVIWILSLSIAHAFFTIHKLYSLIGLLILPSFLPASSIAAIWNAMFGSGSVLAKAIRMYDEQWKYISLFVLFLWKNIGNTIALYLVGMCSLDKSILAAAQVDGANGKIIFLRIELPLLKNVSVFVMLLLLMNGVNIYRESYMLYGAYPPPNLFFVQHYINLSFTRLDFGLLSAAGIFFSGIILCVFSLFWKCLDYGGREEECESIH